MIYVIIGKSCSGKTTLCNLLQTKYNIDKIITSTSRPMRNGEINGVDYNFYTYEQMEEDIKQNKYIEHSQFNNWLYGTRVEDIDINKDCIIVLNPAGFRKLKQLYDYKVVGLYLNPPLFTRLKRIIFRDKGNYREAIRRFICDYKDFKNIEDVIVIRDLTF